MSKRYLNTCTWDKWNVSTCTGSRINGAQLSVFRGFHNGHARYGEANGKMFPDTDSADQYALEHGYTQIHYRRPSAFIHLQLPKATRRFLRSKSSSEKWYWLQRIVLHYAFDDGRYFNAVLVKDCFASQRKEWTDYMNGIFPKR